MEGGDGGAWEGEGGIVNQVLFGDKLIDTDDVYFSDLDAIDSFSEEGPHRTRVMFKHGPPEGVEGEAKAAFDEWAKGRPKAGENVTLVSIVENHEHGHHHTPNVDMTDGHPPIYHSHVHEKYRHHRRPESKPVRVKPEQQGIRP